LLHFFIRFSLDVVHFDFGAGQLSLQVLEKAKNTGRKDGGREGKRREEPIDSVTRSQEREEKKEKEERIDLQVVVGFFQLALQLGLLGLRFVLRLLCKNTQKGKHAIRQKVGR
jgi:hypothetical protein